MLRYHMRVVRDREQPAPHCNARTSDHRAQKPAQDAPEPAVCCPHARSAAGPHEDTELVPQRDVLEHQVGLATARRTQDPQEQKE